MKNGFIVLVGVAVAGAGAAIAQQTTSLSQARVDLAVRESWRAVSPDWRERLVQDKTMRECSVARNKPPPALAAAITAREKETVVYPEDGNFLGDWKKGEELAQSGYGLRFSDYPAARENGGNCYACHQLDSNELSYGTLGPSLQRYGKTRKFAAAEAKTLYERIYNPQSQTACAHMPRFGANKVLTIEQIKDIVALLMDPESPINK